MRTTPLLPDWIREFRHPDYTSIYELRPEETKLYCTETLLGDWDGVVLLLAKDAAPVHVIRDRIEAGEPNPWRNGERGRDPMGWQTNEGVAELAKVLDVPSLYGSALAHLMKKERSTSGSLLDFRSGPLRDHVEKVLQFVVSEMRNLRAMFCLGNEAWDVARSVYAPAARGASPLAQPVASTVADRSLRLFRLYHPSRAFRGGWPARHAEWRRVASAL